MIKYLLITNQLQPLINTFLNPWHPSVHPNRHRSSFEAIVEELSHADIKVLAMAPFDGKVKRIHLHGGVLVAQDDLIVEFV